MLSLVRAAAGGAVRSGRPLRLLSTAARAAGAGAGEGDDTATRTALYDLHRDLGGKMVPFAGYALPVQYEGMSIKESHLHVRSSCGMFDVSHMGQIRLHGKDRVQFLEKLVVGDVAAIPEHRAALSVFTNEAGGIIDDTIITNMGGFLHLVVNGACKHGDIAHIRERLALHGDGLDVSLEVLEGLSLLAVQGPRAMEVLSPLTDGADLAAMPFMAVAEACIAGKRCLLSRCGYTGEDGFEISMLDGDAHAVALGVLAHPAAEPAGLGARDSLRLEAGLCLYGSDLDASTTPVEAGLTWTIGKRRRAEGGFLGAEHILPQLGGKAERRRVGFKVVKGPPARGHEPVFSEDGTQIGEVSSGTYAPSLGEPIGMAYVAKGHHKAGTKIQIGVRKKMVPAVVAKMPFVPSNYYKP